LGHDQSTDALVEGVHTIVHVGLAPPGVGDPQVIDFRTRATYNLLLAAAHQSVQRVIYLSSLAIMLGYDKRFMITEDFRSRPTPDPETLSYCLGEFTCREFARSGDFGVVVLRLGRLENRETETSPYGELPLTKIQDVAAAVASVVGNQSDGNGPDLGPWNVVHIHSEAQSSRFPLTKAERLLRYQPKSTGAVS
jgi:nucleoside-diphosphate-sugar epimerase